MAWRSIPQGEIKAVRRGTTVKLIVEGREYMGCIGRPQPAGGLLYFKENGPISLSKNSGWVQPERLWIEKLD